MSHQGGGIAALTTHLRESFERLTYPGALPASLLEASQSHVTSCDHLSVRRRRFLDQTHTLYQLLLGAVELVPLREEIAQDEVVVCTVDQGLQSSVPLCQ